ncbi:hypothetical protein DERP_012885 [Dermatophagoides pteronyssinus]|uniref:Uncharacterized protein n=1 Tax=Dermatophagoides pteronyssinus TaxID=6956 RepID=A0ABQ8J1Q6_DERPT|nr:hypothetical protein DERP_012885 [Dermatophagoides pteronyssinus]
MSLLIFMKTKNPYYNIVFNLNLSKGFSFRHHNRVFDILSKLNASYDSALMIIVEIKVFFQCSNIGPWN